jgi:hypothetical protein
MVGGLTYGRLDLNVVMAIIDAIVCPMFSTGCTLGWVDQSFMSHQEVTATVVR